MLRSMTAFASAERTVEGGALRWELKSVNHRYLAANPRLPEPLRSLESRVRERVDAALGRGKLDAVLNYWPDRAGRVAIDWSYADELMAACDELAARRGGGEAAVSPLELLRMPGVMTESLPDTEALTDAALALLDEALAELVSAREREGERLAAMLRERVARVAELTEAVAQRHGEVVAAIRERLRARLDALDVEADPGRLEQELAIVAQRLDVDEELSRLRSHCEEVTASLEADGPVGRRLDFLMQELTREANTLSSKSADAETTRCAVDMKVCIEQMREQIQNIE